MDIKEKLNKIKGGETNGMSIDDIAKKHGVSVDIIKKQLKMGIDVEKEHTPDPKMAQEIAMDHLTEFPDYYTRLAKMEKEGEKAIEAKESMGADASGSFEAPFMTNANETVILKKDLHNWKTKQKEVKEITGASVSAGAMYDAPIGTGSKDPLKIDNPRTASITAASNKNMKATKKGFPRFGGPDAKFVEIDNKCKTYPYCDQGASSDNAFKGRPTAIKLKEMIDLKVAIQEAAKKYRIPIKDVEDLVVNGIISEALPRGMFDEPNLKAIKGWTDKSDKPKYKITTIDPIDIVISDDVDLAKLKILFYKYDIDFSVDDIKE